jgi:ubiquinone biosynthesis protein
MLDELGPTFVKFGQVLSTRTDVIPSDIVEELVKLQDHASPLPFELVREVVEQDLDLKLERAFEHFESVPIAAASIGQVHGAVLPGGQKVVVKVQRPAAGRQLRRDIGLLVQFATLMEHRYDFGFSLVEVVEEFNRGINRELDYVREGRNADRFAQSFTAEDNVRIPQVYWRYCSPRILTLERLEGPTLSSSAIAAIPWEEKRVVAEVVTKCWFKMVLKDGFFHADPHPANVLYLGAGVIGLVDFGATGLLRSEDLYEGTNLFLHVMRSDIMGMKRSLKRVGFRWSPSADQAVTEAIEHAFARYFGSSLASMNAAALMRHYVHLVYDLHVAQPARFLLLSKTMLELEGLVSQIYPDLNPFELGRGYALELGRRRASPQVMGRRAVGEMAEYAELLGELPHQVHTIMEQMKAGELEVGQVHTGLEGFIHRLDLITNRLVVALISIGLAVSGTALGIVVKAGPHVAGFSAWGLPGFVVSAFFGVWLVLSVVRSGRL